MGIMGDAWTPSEREIDFAGGLGMGWEQEGSGQREDEGRELGST